MKKQSFQRILSFFLMLCLVICMLPTALAAENEAPTNEEEVVGPPYYVSNENQLRYAVNNAPYHDPGEDPIEIIVTDHIQISATINIPAGKWLTIRSDHGTHNLNGTALLGSNDSIGTIDMFSIRRQGDGSSVLLVVGKHAGFHAPGRYGQQGRFFCRIGPDKKNRPSVLRGVGRVQQPSEGLGDCPDCRALSDRGTVPLSAAAGFHPP